MAAVNPVSGSHIGELFGMSGVLCGVMTDKKTIFVAGESNEILQYSWPWKSNLKKLQNPHTGFINQMQLSPDRSKFATCSLDKTIAVFETETGNMIKHI